MKPAKSIVLACVVAMLVPFAARAGLSYSSTISKTGRKELQNGYVYTVASDLTIKGGSGLSAMYMGHNSTAVLYIPVGVTLTVKGGVGAGMTGGGAGIEVPSDSTLIITGGGKLVAEGGKGADGGGGGDGENANVDGSGKPHDDWGRAGVGGRGGDGGGGAGAGIGGRGGAGGAGRNEPRKASNWHNTNGDWMCRGNNGYSGNSGTKGDPGGTIYVLGTVQVTAAGGAKGQNGGSSGSNGEKDKEYWTLSYRAGGGGGGGGGGSGGAANAIGSGGGGGGAGGGGGEGSRYRTTQGYTYRSANGGHGGGGSGGSTGGSTGGGSRSDGEDGWFVGTGGDGGSGGSGGAIGAEGMVYKAVAANVTGVSSTSIAETHSAIEYTITFSDDWRLSQSLTVKFGYSLPKGPTTSRYGYVFKGWYDGANGTGRQYYDENGDSVVPVWTNAGDKTLYPRWEANSHEDVGEVSLTINGTPIVEGTATSGSGWYYDNENGVICIHGIHGTYDISGKDLHGFAKIQVATNCTLQVTQSLVMEPGARSDYSPISIGVGVSATLDVTTAVNADATCSLMGSSGRTAIRVPAGASLTLRTTGVLNVTGGDGAADIGLDSGDASGGNIHVETYDNWAANIRPGHGLSANNGLLNSSGKGANFYSSATGKAVWSVRMSELGVDGSAKRMYLQRVADDIHDDIRPNANGNAWLWLPNGGYEWAEELNASIKQNNLWVSFVGGAHSAAEFFTPLYIEIDGDDIAHLTGNGWYATRISTTTAAGEGTRATLVITNAGPHVVTGYGNAGIDVNCDTSLTISNLLLSVTSWDGKTALWMPPDKNINLNLTLEGTNRLSSGSGRAGIFVGSNHVVNIDGNGSLQVQGGANAAGIGGCAKSFDTKKSGVININGGHITAIGGANAAAIGGAQTSSANGKISIAGGYVTARGGQYGAAIGGGYTGSAEVSITGGTVFPTAGTKASAIGSGYKGASSAAQTRFGVAAIYTTADKVSPAAKDETGNVAVFPVTFDIGLANCPVTNIVIDADTKVCNDLWTNEGGNLVLWLEPTTEQRTITITAVDDDGTETKKSWGYKIDDNGNYEFSRDVLTVDGELVLGARDQSGTGWNFTKATGIIMFDSGSHSVSGNSTNGIMRIVVTGADVGLSLEGLTLKTNSKDSVSPFIVSNGCTITLRNKNEIGCVSNPNGRTERERGPKYAAGIEVPEGASLTIEGDGTLTANGGLYGAGIGSRGEKRNAGSITINGGSVYASGTGYQNGGGAGIGGGDGGGVASILITGGYVNAVGGNNASGIGGGHDKGVYLTNGTFRVTGGTVLAEKGKNYMGDTSSAFSDFVVGLGNTIDPRDGTQSVVIDGPCSVRPKNAILSGNNPHPWPVNSNGARLVFAMIEGMACGDAVRLVDYLWPQYDGVDILAGDDGAVCLWGEYTNEVRAIQIESPNIAGGSMSFNVSAASNTIYKVSDDYEAPSNRIVNGVTCWRVVVNSLPVKQRLAVTGIDSAYSRGTTVSDKTGVTYLYLPNGEYDFTVGGYAYHASVNNAVTTATFTVGIRVNGVEIADGTLSGTVYGGDGWTYDGTKETLRLTAAADYVISGTNGARRVSVCVTRSGTKIRADRLVLVAAGEGAFYAESPGIEFEYKGGTVSTGSIPSRMIVSGGSLDAGLLEPVAPSGAPAYHVVINGFGRYSHVAIENIEGLDNYDTDGIYANEYGDVHLYLPDGDYYFRTVSGVSTNEMIAIVEGDEAVALNFSPTGVFINGREAARLRGDGWRNEDGMVKLNNATNYVISGTNDGSAVTISATAGGATLTLDGLVMTNELMLASPIAFTGGTKTAQFALALVGTNVIHGAEEGTAAIELGERTSLTVSGDGRLELTGANNQAGIGLAKSAAGTSASLAITSGEIVATGGANGAGIGGGDGQEGFNVNVYGGRVTAVGGANGAGIGGGYRAGGGRVTVTNGMVSATGGVGAAGIGGGLNGASGTYVQKGGTVVARGTGGGADIGAGQGGGSGAGTSTTIVGGSLDSSTANITVQAKNITADNVYCVTIPTGRPNFDIGAVMGDYNGYLLTGAKTDDAGKVYIWLPNGTYYLNIGRVPFRAVVDGADTEAAPWSVGVEVNGEDIALQSGDGWAYGIGTGVLSVFGDGCTISGTNTAASVFVQFTNSVSAVVSNLCLTTTASSAASPLSVLSGAAVTLAIAGENGFASGAGNYAGVNVPHGSSLSITNLDTIVLVPDLNDIQVFTNVLYDIEYDDAGNPKIDPGTGCVITNGVIYDIHAVTNYLNEVVSPKLTAVGANYGAGIGGGNRQSHGTITVFGGVIEASGGSHSAAIGSGYFPDSGDGSGDAATLRQGTIQIYGGEVTANGGQFAAGIGGGNRHSGGVIMIFGGKVVATGGTQACGIGGGWGARAHTISISGGEVTANGSFYAAAIGGSSESHLSVANTEMSQISISGGRVTAITQGEGGAGIGSGRYDNEGAAVNITGGTIVTTAGTGMYGYSTPDDIGIGTCADTNGRRHPLTIKGASVHATHRTAGAEYVSPAPSNGTERVWCVTVDTGKANEQVLVEHIAGFSEKSDIYTDADGKVYLWLPNGTHVFYVGGLPFTATVSNADATASEWRTGVMVDGVDVAYVQAEGNKWYYDIGDRILYIIADCVVSGTNTQGYVNILAAPMPDQEGGVGDKLSFCISNLYIKSTYASPLAVTNGTVTVCLAGDNTLSGADARKYAALSVRPGATLSITNLEEGAKLVARGGEYAAGIGGDRDGRAGHVSISGGVIDAKGGTEGGAGIGSGYLGYVGMISISGGDITAEGGSEGGAGIGGGEEGRFSQISISGGNITANGGEEGAAGIGGGYEGYVGTICISGGRITAIGGADLDMLTVWCGAGIGGGYKAKYYGGASIRISGGTIYAAGGVYDGENAADIGFGLSPDTGYANYKIVFSGSSTYLRSDTFKESDDNRSITPLNESNERVYKTMLTGFTPNAKVEMEMSGYGTNDIYADASGRIFLWLANGVYYYRANGQRYAAQVENGTARVVMIPDAYGVEVDGVDVVNFSGGQWSYDVFSCQLSVTNACVISGTNTDGRVNISVDATSECAITISNLCLHAESGSPIDIVAGKGTLCLVGTNILDASAAAEYPGLHVGMHEGVVITNLHDGAKLVAIGGARAAGIGGNNSDNAGKIVIAGGIIEATGGADGAGIGGGRLYGFAEISITAGTVKPVAGTGAKAIGYGSANSNYIGSEKIVFTGGSIATSVDGVGAQGTTKAVNADGDMVYPVAISGFTPYAKVDMEIEGYNACGIYADVEGKIYPWLEEGDYIFILDGVPHLAHVTSSGAVAEPWLSGVTVDGRDVAYMHDAGGKWQYNAAKRTLYILSGTSPADCVTVSGTNTADYVYVEATNDVYFAISNLNLKTTSAAPIALVCANATVAFAGTNTLDASGASQYAALQSRTAQSAWTSLVLTNLNEDATLVAKGGSGGAGIGCGSTSSSSYCKVYVHGGNITAEGGLNGSGIGGGANGSSEVYIYGGHVTAAGGSYAAGVGGGKSGQGRIDIHGGTVDATATAGGGAGIGGGAGGDGTVNIIDGAVMACGNGLGAGIGGGSGGKGYVYVSGGTVKPIAGTYAASKSVGNGNTTGGEVLFTGGSIHTTVAYVNPAASNANHVAVWPVTVTGLKAGSEITFDGLPSSYGTKGICADEDGEVKLWLPNGDYALTATDDDGVARLYVTHVVDAPTDATYSAMTGFTVNGCDVAYLSGEGWSYNNGAVNGGITLYGLDHYELSGALTNKYLTISNSCSIVFSNVVFNSFNIDTQHGIVNIAGAYDVNLTIEGVNSVKAPAGGYLAGIRVHEGATLTIDGGGSLESTAGPYAAGIGGGRNTGCGAITINGGTVTATGGNYAAGIGGGGPDAVFAGTITIAGGDVTATGGSYAAGIGGGGESNGGSVEITGGRVTATSGSGGGACIGAGKNGTYGDVVISGGTVVASTDEYRTHAIGDGFGTDGFGKVTITGGSVHADPAGVTPVPSNGTEVVCCVTVPGLAPNSPVAFSGLPDYYGTSGIVTDAGGKVYLWLPEDWETTHTIMPQQLTGRQSRSGSPRLGSGTVHTFAANGYSYTVTMSPEGAVAVKGDPLSLESIRIDGFVVADGYITIRFTAKPATWLYGFGDLIRIRASETLPIPDTDDAILDLSGAELYLDGADSATLVVPLGERPASGFFKVESRTP